jgi:hypothetical protein
MASSTLPNEEAATKMQNNTMVITKKGMNEVGHGIESK